LQFSIFNGCFQYRIENCKLKNANCQLWSGGGVVAMTSVRAPFRGL
jgi:hypothetical protein